jgi:hypothetical protein
MMYKGHVIREMGIGYSQTERAVMGKMKITKIIEK